MARLRLLGADIAANSGAGATPVNCVRLGILIKFHPAATKCERRIVWRFEGLTCLTCHSHRFQLLTLLTGQVHTPQADEKDITTENLQRCELMCHRAHSVRKLICHEGLTRQIYTLQNNFSGDRVLFFIEKKPVTKKKHKLCQAAAASGESITRRVQKLASRRKVQ